MVQKLRLAWMVGRASLHLPSAVMFDVSEMVHAFKMLAMVGLKRVDPGFVNINKCKMAFFD
jgi:hypothetical protein